MSKDYKWHLGYLLLVAALVLTAGMGLGDLWPADEPQYALIAKDWVESGNWFLPRAGGGLYSDKPPLFFGLIAAVHAVSGSTWFSLFVPGLLAGLGALFLVTDLARRLWGPKTAIWCGATLLALLQFPLQMKSGQIEGLLCFFTTLGLYGLCRHLLLGPDWRWLSIGSFAAGLGVIAGGAGFLPLLVIVPYLFAARSGWDVPRYRARDRRWFLAPVAFLGATSLWLVPMLLANGGSPNPDMLAYRDNILIHQTIGGYASAWGLIMPPWYWFNDPIPWLWLPASFLLPWLVPRWIGDLKAGSAAVMVLGGWVLFVLLFFSVSPGARSLNVLPATPAFALIVGLHAEALLRRIGVQRLLVAIPAIMAVLLTAAGTYALMNPAEVKPWLGDVFVLIKTSAAVIVTGIVMFAAVVVCRRRKVLAGYAISMLAFWLGVSLLLAPALDGLRAGVPPIHRAETDKSPGKELAFVAWPVPEHCYDRREAVNPGTAHQRQRQVARCDSGVAEPRLLLHDSPVGSLQLVKSGPPLERPAKSANKAAR